MAFGFVIGSVFRCACGKSDIVSFFADGPGASWFFPGSLNLLLTFIASSFAEHVNIGIALGFAEHASSGNTRHGKNHALFEFGSSFGDMLRYSVSSDETSSIYVFRRSSCTLVFSSSHAVSSSCIFVSLTFWPFLLVSDGVKSRSLLDVCGSTVHHLYPSGSFVIHMWKRVMPIQSL